MADEVKDTRQLIAKHLRVLRTLQAFQTGNVKKSVNELAQSTNMPWTSLKNVLNSFISEKIIDKDYTIKPSSAYFMGISMSQDKFNISIVGLDGKCLDLKQISNELKNSTKFLDNFEFEYSLQGLIELSKHITNFIYDLKSVYPIKAVCLSFDDADLGSKAFSTSNHFTNEVINSYPFEKICNLYFRDLINDIEFFLDCNSACYVLSKKFPCLKKEGNQVYLYLAKTGCFITPVIDGKIHYGYNLQTLNVTTLLSEKEKRATSIELLSILQKIITPFIISLAPDYLSIGTNLFSSCPEQFEHFFNQMPALYGCLFKGYIYPDYQLDIFPDISIGTAISAMYQYYGWNFNFI